MSNLISCFEVASPHLRAAIALGTRVVNAGVLGIYSTNTRNLGGGGGGGQLDRLESTHVCT